MTDPIRRAARDRPSLLPAAAAMTAGAREPGPRVLWGMPASLYTAKARAFLRKRRIAFTEAVPGDPRFASGVVPEVGRWIIPVLQEPDGTLVQDGAAIIDHVDAIATEGPPAQPPDPALAAIARLLELFGGEGLLRPAMHYRWNFDADNLDFLQGDFGASLAPGLDDAARAASFARSSARMRKAAAGFGVHAATAPTIERALAELLGILERHFGTTPYLLGPAPTVADYGLYGPLGGHLGRDPHPSGLIKRTAPRTWRWIERMGAPDADAGEYVGATRAWLDAARPGETLEALLRYVATEFLPELQAQVAFADDWLAQRPDLPAGDSGLPRPGDRSIGRVGVAWRDHRIEVAVMPYRLWLLQRFQDAAAALGPTDAAGLHGLLARTGLASATTLRCRRRVERRGHVEVWGPAR